MPFKSGKQRRYLFAKKPEVAKKFAKDSLMTKPIPPRKPGESMSAWSERVKESADHWFLCLSPNTNDTLCKRKYGSCSTHRGRESVPWHKR